jgi:uncharacterized membrane protein
MFHLPYYLLMHFWLGVGQSLWWMRLPSLLAGAATVQALVLLARRWLPLGWSVLAGFLLALNPLFVELTLLARPYTGAALFAVLSTAALVNAIDRGGRRRWALYGFASLCMLLLHLLAVFVLAAQLAGIVLARRRSASAGMVSTIGCVAAAVSPLAVIVAREGQIVSWIAPSTLSTFHQALADVSGGRAEELALVACGIIVTASLAFTPPASDRALGFALCLAWGAAPVLLLVLAGFLHPLYVPRYAVGCLPGIALIEALAGWRVSTFLTAKGRTWRAFALAALTFGAACVAGLPLLGTASNVLQSRYWGDDYRSAAAELSSGLSRRPAPVAVIPNYAGIGFSYYAAPPALAHVLIRQAIREYNQNLIDWQGVTLARGTGEPLWRASVIGWPVGAKPEVPATRCEAGWAIGRGWVIGRGGAPSKTFIIDGSSCRVRWVRYYGAVWVASLSG